MTQWMPTMSPIDPESPPLTSLQQDPASLSSKYLSQNEAFLSLPSPSAEPAHPLAAYGPMTILGPREGEPELAAWLWPGYLVCGGTTLLTSFWKSGKTTLLSVL